jgi:hypothetical protein
VVMKRQNRSVGGARCVAAIAAAAETSHVAEWKAVRPAEEVRSMYIE